MFNLFRKNKISNNPALINQLIGILEHVKSYITDDSDSIWAGYDTPAELRKDIDKYILDLKNGKLEVVERINVEFAVTSTFQEHSLSNGWEDAFLLIAEEFDSVYRILKK